MRALGNLTLLVSWLQMCPPRGCLARSVVALAPGWRGVDPAQRDLSTAFTSRPALCSVVALATWLASGRAVWILPNVMSEELPISQIFKPLVSVSRPEEGKGRCELLAFNM